MATELGPLVLDESKRLIARQEASLNDFRARSLGLLSAAGLIAGIFTAARSSHHSHWQSGCIAVALTAFVLLASLAIWVLLPRKWDFAHDLDSWIEDLRLDNDVPASAWFYNVSRDLETVPQEERRQDREDQLGDLRHVRPLVRSDRCARAQRVLTSSPLGSRLRLSGSGAGGRSGGGCGTRGAGVGVGCSATERRIDPDESQPKQVGYSGVPAAETAGPVLPRMNSA